MTRHAVRISAVLLAAAGGLGAVWYGTRPAPVAVELATVQRGTVEQIVSNTRAGTIKACRRARLAPAVGGQIARLPVTEGQRVKADSLLLELWNDDLSAQVALAERETEASAKKAQAACLNAAQAQREFERMETLQRRGVTSEDTVDKARTGARSAEAECEAARASERVSQARVGVARANISKTRLLAPFDGVVAEVNGELFEYVTPSPPGIPTPPAVDLIDDACFYVAAPIDEVDAASIRVGQSARISLDAFGERQFAGSVRRIAPYVLDLEKQARTVEVEVVFKDGVEKDVLLAGYSADVEIITDHRDEVLRVSTEALMDENRLYRFTPDPGKIERIEVATGLHNWDWTEIRSGLGEGERIVVSLDRDGLEDGASAIEEKTPREGEK